MKRSHVLFLTALAACALAVPGGAEVVPATAATVQVDASTAPTWAAFSSVTESDADRGCCVLRSNPVKCAYSNRKYCRTKAEESKVSFGFVKDTACSRVSECPSAS